MLLQVNDPVVVGPTSSFGEVWVLPDGGAEDGIRTFRGGIVIGQTDFNPERIQLDDEILLDSTPDANVGDRFTRRPSGCSTTTSVTTSFC